MAGIVATSATTNNSASTAVDTSVSGYLAGEAVTLTTDPAGSAYVWSLSVPSGSSSAILTGVNDTGVSTSAAPRFAPDVGGYYVISVPVATTPTYVMRLAAVNVGTVGTIGTLRLRPLADNQVTAPATGQTFYYSSTQASLAVKNTDNSVETINTTAV